MNKKKKSEIGESIASIEVFGGVFALLIVLYVIMNVFSSFRLEERLDALSNDGEYKISWGENGEGYVVIAYPDSLFIIENGKFLKSESICNQEGAFVNYANTVYSVAKNQIIFAILENGVTTMKQARDCLQKVYPNKRVSIGWIVIDDQTMKSIKLNDLPYYMKDNNER
ncbi:hypothetical protein [Aliivibrio finisterrensis]|uniref:Uncharacterized protein n=1 Tax=Aliivibrio finisterrensis TaxID=511998 RepID=A0A6N6RXE6_9GAMM|nr:hypothetical protein [Aliivibrio finisterrensis]KAB2826462.1 hypothetical protein F8B77_00975 [Aliivibrio finisterrensis]